MKEKKRIIIFSYDDDFSTSEVIAWLNRTNTNVLRIDGKKPIEIKKIYFSKKGLNITVQHSSGIFQTQTICSFWYRRGLAFSNTLVLPKRFQEISFYIKEEIKAVNQLLMFELDKKLRINGFCSSNLNKLIQLENAYASGLNIPNTILISNKKELIKISFRNCDLITKSINIPFIYRAKEKVYNLMTNRFTKSDIKKTNTTFQITKFQENIKKEIELRIFYLNKTFYAMAIFSQNNEKTKIDFRNYDEKKPNRCVPFLIPQNIQIKLKEFMARVKLQSGSIDMIIDKVGQYYFLEVNPVGQFGMVSHPCNYYIEEKLSKLLLKK